MSPVKHIYINKIIWQTTRIQVIHERSISLAPSLSWNGVAFHGNNYFNKTHSFSHYSRFDTETPICFILSWFFSCLCLCPHSLPSPFRGKEQFGFILSVTFFQFSSPNNYPQKNNISFHLSSLSPLGIQINYPSPLNSISFLSVLTYHSVNFVETNLFLSYAIMSWKE